jgi:hypothetical protein
MASQFALTPEKKRRIAESQRKKVEAEADYDPSAPEPQNRAVPLRGDAPMLPIDLENQSMRERVASIPRSIASGLGADMTYANRLGEDAASFVDFAPLLGDAVGIDDTIQSAKRGDWWDTGINAASSLAGVAPVGGDILGKAIKKLGKKGGSEVVADVGRAAAKAPAAPVTRDDIVKAGAKGPTEEVVAPHASGDPKTNYSKLVSNKPLNEVTAGYENTAPLLPKKPFSPEQMEIGSNVLGIMGDRSGAGRRLMSIEGQPLTQGTDLRGGEGFTRGEAQQSYGAGWANEAGPAGALQNKINSNADRPTYLWYLPMSEQSIDASRHVSRPTFDLLKQAEPSREAIEDYLPRLQKGIVDEKGLDIVPPLQQGQSAADYLLGLQGWSETASMKGRRALAQTLDTAKSRNNLGVDMGKIRLAATDPDLVNANTFEAGHSILRAEPGGSLIKDPMLDHPDYGTQIPAVYQGRTETPVPYEDLFDDWARAREAKKPGEPASQRAYTFRLSNPTQEVTQELIDRLMMRQEMIRRIGGSGGSR